MRVKRPSCDDPTTFTVCTTEHDLLPRVHRCGRVSVETVMGAAFPGLYHRLHSAMTPATDTTLEMLTPSLPLVSVPRGVATLRTAPEDPGQHKELCSADSFCLMET